MRAWTRLAATNLYDFFDTVITFDDTKKRKPNPLPFRKAATKLKIAPENILMVGDHPDRDIAGAKKFGMKTCFARYGTVKNVKSSGADFEIRNIRELLSVVKKLNPNL